MLVRHSDVAERVCADLRCDRYPERLCVRVSVRYAIGGSHVYVPCKCRPIPDAGGVSGRRDLVHGAGR